MNLWQHHRHHITPLPYPNRQNNRHKRIFDILGLIKKSNFSKSIQVLVTESLGSQTTTFCTLYFFFNVSIMLLHWTSVRLVFLLYTCHEFTVSATSCQSFRQRLPEFCVVLRCCIICGLERCDTLALWICGSFTATILLFSLILIGKEIAINAFITFSARSKSLISQKVFVTESLGSQTTAFPAYISSSMY